MFIHSTTISIRIILEIQKFEDIIQMSILQLDISIPLMIKRIQNIHFSITPDGRVILPLAVLENELLYAAHDIQ